MQAVFLNQTEFRRMCRHMLFSKNGFAYADRLQAVGKNAYHKQDRNIDHHGQAACVPVQPGAAARRSGAAVKGLLIMHISIQTFAKITMILIIAHNNSRAFFTVPRNRGGTESTQMDELWLQTSSRYLYRRHDTSYSMSNRRYRDIPHLLPE